MGTWGVKVSEDLKIKLSDAMKKSGLEGEEFAEQLYTLYATEIMKKEKPAIAQELEELQRLIQRIYAIYLNASERTDNLIQAKSEVFESNLFEKDEQISEIKAKLSDKASEYETLIEAFNTLSDNNKEAQKEIFQLQDSIDTKQTLIDEYKEKNDNLLGMLKDLKKYKDEVETTKELLADCQTRNFNLDNTITKLKIEYENTITKQNDEHEITVKKLTDNVKSLENSIEKKDKDHAAELISVENQMNFIKDKALLEQEKEFNKKINDLITECNNKVSLIQEQANKQILSYQKEIDLLLNSTSKKNKNKNTESSSSK